MDTYSTERDRYWEFYLLHMVNEHPSWPVIPCHDAFFEGFKYGTVAAFKSEVDKNKIPAQQPICSHCGTTSTEDGVPHLWYMVKGIGFSDKLFCTYRCLWGYFNHGDGAITGGSGFVNCPCGLFPQTTPRLIGKKK